MIMVWFYWSDIGVVLLYIQARYCLLSHYLPVWSTMDRVGLMGYSSQVVLLQVEVFFASTYTCGDC